MLVPLFTWALLATPLPPQIARAAPLEDVTPRVAALARELIEAGYAQGLVVGILRGDEHWVRGFGRVRPRSDDVPDGDTVFEIGSVSKVFTALLLADAAVRGRLSLEDPATGLAPEGVRLPSFQGAPIRLVHLATHTSGLPRVPANLRPADVSDPYADYELADLWEFLAAAELERAPGARYEYSNLGAGLLGTLLAHSSGATYAERIEERIARPLGLDDTRVHPSDAMRARLAAGRDVDGRPRASWHASALAGAGMIRSTVTDLLVFARAQIEPGNTPLGEAIELSQRVHHAGENGAPAVALGWHLGSGGATLWHNGQTGGYRAFLGVWPEGRSAVAALATTTSERVDVLADGAMRLLMGAEARPLELQMPIELAEDTLARYAGRYRLSPFNLVRVTLEGGALWARLDSQDSFRLYPSSPTRFFLRAVPAEIAFELDDEGRATALVLDQYGRQQRAPRSE